MYALNLGGSAPGDMARCRDLQIGAHLLSSPARRPPRFGCDRALHDQHGDLAKLGGIGIAANLESPVLGRPVSDLRRFLGPHLNRATVLDEAERILRSCRSKEKYRQIGAVRSQAIVRATQAMMA